MQNHLSKEEAKETFQAAFDEVSNEDRWCAVVWKVSDGMITLHRATTNNFPHGDMIKALVQLGQFFIETQSTDRILDPLPQVNLEGVLDRVFKPADGDLL